MKDRITLHRKGSVYFNNSQEPCLCGPRLRAYFDIDKHFDIDIVVSTVATDKSYPVTIQDDFHIHLTDSRARTEALYMYYFGWDWLKEFAEKHNVDTIHVSLEQE